MLVSTALSSSNISRSGAIPPAPAVLLCQVARRGNVVAVLLNGLEAALLSRPVQPPERSANGLRVHPYVNLGRRAVRGIQPARFLTPGERISK
jgi:hypothetical protein